MVKSPPSHSQTRTINRTITDTFSDARPAGQAIGTVGASGFKRQGIDQEQRVAIDNGALRFQPLSQSGWGRQGIAYGPYKRAHGLAFAVFLLNGHNTSQVGHIQQSFYKRVLRWLYGSGADWIVQRLIGLLLRKPKRSMIRQLVNWWHNSPRRAQHHQLDENLAIGWFPRSVPINPLAEGNALIMHALGPENGALWSRVGTEVLPALSGVQNLQAHYIVILREIGAAYYAASVPGARGMGTYPHMRPLAIDAVNVDATVYAAVYQSVLGQIGFRVDTRIYSAHIEQLSDLATWYGTAHAADRLIGRGPLSSTRAEQGGLWYLCAGDYELTAQGARASSDISLGILDPGIPSGLIHALVDTSNLISATQLVWRLINKNNYWSFWISQDACQLQIQEQGASSTVATSNAWFLHPNTTHSLQILDDGATFSIYLDGDRVFDTAFADTRLHQGNGVGFGTTQRNPNQYIRAFEAHPRQIPIPATLQLGSPWLRLGTQAIVVDEFGGEVKDLAGTVTARGSRVWHRAIGKGRIHITGQRSAKVQATAKHPNPGRTAYTVAWENSEFADIEVTLTPPGTKRGQQEKGRSGLIFWQDTDNYIILNNWLDDGYGGASVSSFFHLNGFEELYDAVWTNVGNRIQWGIPHRFRVVFDGLHYTVLLNEEPVLYRSLTDVYPTLSSLAINQVGIVANWEWGNDTGSVFENFIGRV
jgi:hypothetical protein